MAAKSKRPEPEASVPPTLSLESVEEKRAASRVTQMRDQFIRAAEDPAVCEQMVRALRAMMAG